MKKRTTWFNFIDKACQDILITYCIKPGSRCNKDIYMTEDSVRVLVFLAFFIIFNNLTFTVA